MSSPIWNNSNSYNVNYTQNYNNGIYGFTYTDNNYYTVTGTGHYTSVINYTNIPTGYYRYNGSSNIVWNGEGVLTQDGDTFLVSITVKGDETFNNMANWNYNSSVGSTVHGGTLNYNKLVITQLNPVTNTGTQTNTGAQTNSDLFANEGTQVNTGTLTNTGVLTNSGIITGEGGIFTQTAGITTNTGTIDQGAFAINGGTFYQQAGSLAVDSIVNNGQFDYSGGTLLTDAITNNGQFNVSLSGSGAVTGNFINNGTVAVTETNASFTGDYIENGMLIIDPSTIHFNNLTIGQTGLILGYDQSMVFVDGKIQGLKLVNGMVTNLYGDMNIFYDPSDNTDLGGLTYALSSYNGTGGGYLRPTPIPATLWIFGPALLGLIGIRRRSARN
jgi:hypothetical protein